MIKIPFRITFLWTNYLFSQPSAVSGICSCRNANISVITKNASVYCVFYVSSILCFTIGLQLSPVCLCVLLKHWPSAPSLLRRGSIFRTHGSSVQPGVPWRLPPYTGLPVPHLSGARLHRHPELHLHLSHRERRGGGGLELLVPLVRGKRTRRLGWQVGPSLYVSFKCIGPMPES